MSGTSFEATLELWALSLREAKARMRPLFLQERMARSAGLFLDGLLGPERRKTGWMRAEAAGDPGPWRQQAVVGRGRWEADGLRDVVCDYALEVLADPGAVLVVDGTGFPKQGKASCGVRRQYTGSAGKITNCQIGVFRGAPVSLSALLAHAYVCKRAPRSSRYHELQPRLPQAVTRVADEGSYLSTWPPCPCLSGARVFHCLPLRQAASRRDPRCRRPHPRARPSQHEAMYPALNTGIVV